MKFVVELRVRGFWFGFGASNFGCEVRVSVWYGFSLKGASRRCWGGRVENATPASNVEDSEEV